jgi:hypothetical protein
VLSCDQAGAANTPPSPRDLTVAGITFSDIAAQGPSAPGSLDMSVGARHYLFRKIFLYVSRNAAPRTTISVLQPADALLYYTDGSTWTSALADATVIESARSTVTVANCNDDTTGYFGGILVASPTCVTLTVTTDPPSAVVPVRLPIPGGQC